MLGLLLQVLCTPWALPLSPGLASSIGVCPMAQQQSRCSTWLKSVFPVNLSAVNFRRNSVWSEMFMLFL